MSDTYFELPSRIEANFPEIDSDIVMDLWKTDEEYAQIKEQISKMKKQYPFIMQLLEEAGEIRLTAEEHETFVQYLRICRKLDDMERQRIYFRGHTDAVAYLKKIGAI